MIRTVALAGIFFLSLPLGAEEKKPLVLMAVKIAGLFDTAAPGPYNEIYDRLTEGYSTPISLREAPLRRAITAFVRGDVDCYLFGTGMRRIYTEQGISDADLLVSDEVNAIALKVYSLKGEPVFHSRADMKGHYIALDQGAISVSGAANQLSLDPDTLLPAQTLHQAFLLLRQGRVAGVVAFDSDVAIYQRREHDEQSYVASDTFSVDASSDSVVCRRTDLSEQFMKHVNGKLVALKETGELERILENSGK